MSATYSRDEGNTKHKVLYGCDMPSIFHNNSKILRYSSCPHLTVPVLTDTFLPKLNKDMGVRPFCDSSVRMLPTA